MLHQQFRALHGALQRFDLLYPQIGLRAGRLALRKGVVHLCAGVEQRLLERQLRFLLLRLGDLHAGAVGIGVEDRLQKRCRCRPQYLAGILDPHAAVVGPSERAAQRDRGIKGRTCFAGGVVRLHERILGAADVGTVRKHLYGHAHRQVVGQPLSFEPAALDLVRAFGQQRAETVLGHTDLVFQIVQRRFDRKTGAFVLGDGGFVGHAGLLHRPHRAHALAPFHGGLLGYLILPVEHQQRVIEVCNA